MVYGRCRAGFINTKTRKGELSPFPVVCTVCLHQDDHLLLKKSSLKRALGSKTHRRHCRLSFALFCSRAIDTSSLQAKTRRSKCNGWRFMACPSVIADVGEDLLAMCQRNIALNSHLTASRGEAQRVFCLGGRCLCLASETNTQDCDPGRGGSTCFPLHPGECREQT